MTTSGSKRRVLIVTGHHFAEAPRKVDLHFMADALRAGGDHVDFLACRLSFLSRFLKDGRFIYARQRPLNRWNLVGEELEEFLWYAPFHPMNLKLPLLNALSGPLFRLYDRLLPKAVMDRMASYTHILIESGPPPLLTHRMRQAAPKARIIYHAADRLKTIRVHPCVEQALAKGIGDYDLIHIMAEAMRADFPADAPILYLPHGIARDSFDRAVESPYATPRNAVSVGDMLFDARVIDTLAAAYPDWTFHLFGKKAVPSERRTNIVVHGEVAFETIVPFIKFADIGLAPYGRSEGADYLSQSSLKMIQYSYCRLPIVAPTFAAGGRDHVCAYDPGDEASIIEAFRRAQSFDRETIETASIRGWQEAVRLLFDHKDVK
jgi:2-beta-glucuronyltransferase